MKKEHGGKVYVQVPEKERESCKECVADHDQPLCSALHVQGKRCDGKILEEEMSERKTALELVDGLRDKMKSFNGTVLFDCVEEIKSAIERELLGIGNECVSGRVIADTHRAIAEERVKELECEIEKANQTIEESRKQWADDVAVCNQEINKLHDQLSNAITMRPISELPDKVPDGCVIVCVNDDVITGTWYYMLGMLKLSQSDSTHFCIIPLPVKERKLKPCPWCGAMPVKLTNYWNIKHTDACPIQSASVIMFEKCDTWGWE